MSANRAERRRQARHREAVIIKGPGEGIAGFVAAGSGHVQRAAPSADLPPKVPGHHRWVVTAAWVVDDTVAAEAFDTKARHLMDNGHLLDIGVVCWDCEQPLGDGTGQAGTIQVGSTCPAPGDE